MILKELEKLANVGIEYTFKYGNKISSKKKEVKEIIEKLKCCGNCKNYNNFHRHCEFDATHSVGCRCDNYKLWEIKEK